MSFLLKNYSLVEFVYIFIRCNKTKFFLWNTNKTVRNGANKQKTDTKHLEKVNIGKGGGGGGSNYEPVCFLKFSFYSARWASNDVNTFLKLRFIKKQQPAGFFEKILCANKLKLRRFH